MTDPGLNHRLRQRSRRAGIMIGISMLFTIAVCVGSFSVIYAGLDDIVGDFVSRTDADDTPTPIPTEVAEDGQAEAEAPEPTEPPNPEPTAPPEESDEEPAATEEADDDESGFQPDYQIDSTGSVNFRTGPGTEYEILYALPLEAPLEYLGISEPTQNPDADDMSVGQVWMQFVTEDGEEGWIRELDVSEYVP